MSTPQHRINSGFGYRSTAAEVLEGIDLSGRLAVVTGGYSGLGLETTRALVGAGAPAVAGGVTIWSGLDTVNNPGVDRVKAECKAGDENCELYKQGRAKQTRTNILIGVTGVFAVATGVLAAVVDWGPPALPTSDEAKKRLRLTPYVGWSHGPSVGARGSF